MSRTLSIYRGVDKEKRLFGVSQDGFGRKLFDFLLPGPLFSQTFFG